MEKPSNGWAAYFFVIILKFNAITNFILIGKTPIACELFVEIRYDFIYIIYILKFWKSSDARMFEFELILWLYFSILTSSDMEKNVSTYEYHFPVVLTKIFNSLFWTGQLKKFKKRLRSKFEYAVLEKWIFEKFLRTFLRWRNL